MKQAEIFMYNKLAGMLTEDENGFTFQYDSDYLNSSDPEAISLTMPLNSKPYHDKVLFPFFDGLIPEDTEELALTLNGKKRKLKRSDFEVAFAKSGLDKKVGENIFLKFEKVAPLWLEFIERSFLSEDMKAEYKGLVRDRI